MIKIILLDAGGVLYLNKDGKGYINPPLLSFIQQNQGRYIFGVISTTQYDLNDILTKDNIRQLFAIVLTTGKENLDKSEPEIYRLALKRLNASAEEAVFIDNSEEYVQAAEKAGLIAILYTAFEKLGDQLQALGIIERADKINIKK
jgi:FMN phosphatase YigB (HAD superfamily)